VFITRMLPGTRLPTYTACGFLRADLRRFVLGVIAATLVWTSLLFGAALLLGNYLLVQLGTWGWAAGPALAIAVLLLGRVVGHWRDRRSGLVQP
jgi:membrane protein DedA with SNARE-associated domain